MIKIKNIPKEERVKLFHNFEYYSYLIWRKDSCMKRLHDTLINSVGVENSQELWVILTHIGKCIRYGSNGYFISLKYGHYTAANKTFSVKLNSGRMKETLLELEQLGYINFYLGFYHKDRDGSLSAVQLNSSVISLFNNLVVKIQGVSRDTIDETCVEVVDKVNTKVIKRFNPKNGKVAKMKDVKYKDTRGMKGISKIKKDLQAYNKCIGNHKITVDLGNGDEPSNCIVYKRVFENDLTTCGRYYTLSTFQTLPSQYRPSIKIDGEETVELDFKNCHPRLIADVEGIILPDNFDCYDIPSLKEIGINRELTKQMLFPMLFSESMISAIRAINLKLREANITNVKGKRVVDEFMKHNSFMNEYFFSEGFYGELQFLDSSIATLIIDHFTKKDVVVLCYHDSFRVQKQYQQELYDVMKESYKAIIGSNENVLITLM